MKSRSGSPVVSAVIITYNQESFVSQAIEGALRQDISVPYEIVVGEDCSTDRTLEVVRSYQDRYPDRIRVVTGDQNVGLLRNFDRTVRSARGRYVAGCAGDDFWHNPAKLRIQCEFLDSHPEFGMVYGDQHLLDEDEARILPYAYSHNKNLDFGRGDLEAFLLGKFHVAAGTVMFRKNIFDTCYDIDELIDHGIVMEDTPLWIEILSRSEGHFIPESVLTHREMTGTVANPASFAKTIAFRQSAYRCLKYYAAKYANRLSNTREVLESIDSRIRRALFLAAFDHHRPRRILRIYRNALTAQDRSCMSLNGTTKVWFSFLPGGTMLHELIRRSRRVLTQRPGRRETVAVAKRTVTNPESPWGTKHRHHA